MRSAPAGAVCSMRAAMFTAMPRMVPSASTPPPSSTAPVWMPTRTLKPAWPCAARTSLPSVAAEFEQRQAAAHRALGIVLARFVGTEHGEQVVAGVLQHLAVVGFDDRGEARQRAVHDRVIVFGVEVLAQRGGAHDVEKQDADLLERLRRLGSARLAQRSELGASRGSSGVDDRIAKSRALGLQRGDAASSCCRSVDISDEDSNTPSERAIANRRGRSRSPQDSSSPTRASPSRWAPGSCPCR